MTLTEVLRNEPMFLWRFFGENAPDIVSASISEMDPIRLSEPYTGNANLLDRIDWLAEEIACVEDDPDEYDTYVELLFHLPLTSMMLIIEFLKLNYPSTYNYLLDTIRNEDNPRCQQIHQRLRRALQQMQLSHFVDQDSLYLLKEAMA